MARQKRGSLPSYRPHKASGQAVVTLGGRDFYLGKYDTPESRSEYARLLAESAVNADFSKPGKPSSEVLVVEVLAAYWQFVQNYYVKNGKPTDEVVSMKLVIRDIRAMYARTPAEPFGPLPFAPVVGDSSFPRLPKAKPN